MSDMGKNPTKLEMAQYISDEYLDKKRVIKVSYLGLPSSAQITFEDGTRTGIAGLLAHKIGEAK